MESESLDRNEREGTEGERGREGKKEGSNTRKVEKQSKQLESLRIIATEELERKEKELEEERKRVVEELTHLEKGLVLLTWRKGERRKEQDSAEQIKGQVNANAGAFVGLTFAELEAKKAELKKQIEVLQRDAGRKLPKGPEPPRNKVHWDYLLEEMDWMANDFRLERRWKVIMAKKVAKAITQHFSKKEVCAIFFFGKGTSIAITSGVC